jgi:methyltransferase (TIGR00027 family)
MPSRTALGAAYHRATHQVVENAEIFADPLALRILGETPESLRQRDRDRPADRRMRFFVATRTRFAEDALAAEVERGVTQLVVLGAGLDTYAYRGAMRGRLRIFEVDHPATQAWKRERLAEAGIAEPPGLIFSPIDFETETLPEGLAKVGFDAGQPSFFMWLGVVPYLSKAATWATLEFIGGLPAGAHVVFDYGDPPESLSAEARAYHDLRAARVKELGEPWINYFDPLQLHAELRRLGFEEIEDRVVSPQGKGGHVLRASARAKVQCRSKKCATRLPASWV